MKKNIVPFMTKMALKMTNSKQDSVQIVESIERKGEHFKHDRNIT